MKVFRWQDQKGRGPYQIGISLYWKDDDHEARNPAMQDEFGWHVFHKMTGPEHCGCAFKTVDQMRAWFTGREQERMRLLGFVFGSMEVDRIVAESGRQVVFARRLPLCRGFAEEAA